MFTFCLHHCSLSLVIQFSLRLLDSFSFERYDIYNLHSCLHHVCAMSPALMHRVCPACQSLPRSYERSERRIYSRRGSHIATNTLLKCQLSSMSPDALTLPLLVALCTPLPVPRPAPDPDVPVTSMPSICSDSSCFSSMCTSSPAQTCIVGCHTITTLSSDVLTAVQCSPSPGAQQKSEGRAV